MIPRSIAVKALRLRIDVEKSSSHHLSQNEIASDNPCSRHLSLIDQVSRAQLISYDDLADGFSDGFR